MNNNIVMFQYKLVSYNLKWTSFQALELAIFLVLIKRTILSPSFYCLFFEFLLSQIQGSKFDPEGEYVRQWLPELARMPTEWIHHPWDAPLLVLKAAGVELGQNYPKPIIELDLARERLTGAIFKMWEMEASARASDSGGTNEVVVDNSVGTGNLAIPKVMLKEKAPCSTISSNDQKVPTIQNPKCNPAHKKRSKYIEEERPNRDKMHKGNGIKGTSRTDEDLCSTAESSATEKQATSRFSFSVPQYCSSSESQPLHEVESSDVRQPLQVQIDREHVSSKDGKLFNFLFSFF